MLRFIIAAALIAFGCLTSIAFAQVATETAVAPSSWLYDVWTIVQPIVAVFATIVGPALATWIALKFVSVLNITDENRRKELETRIRDALHASAANGLRYALTKAGITTFAPGIAIPPSILNEAIEYVRSKNPDTAEQAGVDDRDLEQIILSKVPDLLATLAAAKR